MDEQNEVEHIVLFWQFVPSLSPRLSGSLGPERGLFRTYRCYLKTGLATHTCRSMPMFQKKGSGRFSRSRADNLSENEDVFLAEAEQDEGLGEVSAGMTQTAGDLGHCREIRAISDIAWAIQDSGTPKEEFCRERDRDVVGITGKAHFASSSILAAISLIPYNRYILWSIGLASFVLYSIDRERPANKLELLEASIEAVGEALKLAKASCTMNYAELADITH
ncbi:hypothetical protein C8R45DRAFT_941245 [Mycena sanguinolenta]|nr:hypothetical protein C8R45DRAFT_941245 [Mycena sanguinolenta]